MISLFELGRPHCSCVRNDCTVTRVNGPRQGPGRPAGVDSYDTRRRVIDAACKCFSQYGYGPSTNTVIAELAGVTAGSVYYHFGTKRNLFAVVCEQVYGHLIERTAKVITTALSVRQLLSATLAEFVQINRESPDLAAFMVAAPVDARRHPELAESFAAQAQLMGTTLVDAVVRGQAASEIDSDLEPGQVAMVIRALVTGFAHTAVAYTSEEIDRAAELFTTVLLGLPGPTDSPA